MLTFIKDHDDCFERSLAIGHITASAWLLNKAQTHALLMHHAKLDRWVSWWTLRCIFLCVECCHQRSARRIRHSENIEPVSDTIFDIRHSPDTGK